MNICVPQILILKSNPQCDGIWRGAFGRSLDLDEVMGVESHNGTGTLIRG